ncbi:arylsulfatase [Saccharicrinis sp. 156]|uniref:arylsulfatase n=1 Tax=Saccharicrinis sp. 156 TaxID=3417574 RepID=UPI003D324964
MRISANKIKLFLLHFIILWMTAQVISAIKRPNVILIVTDDQGYGDFSCHGNPVIKTPNIDKLYDESVRFTDFHVDPTCAPTRGALMTGKYSHRAGVWHTIAGGNHLRASEITMADVFKASGYRTGAFGKWHLGSNYPYRPMDRGFDEWLGHGDGGTGTTDDWFDNDRVDDMYWHNGEREKRAGYAPDVFFDAATDFIKEGENDEPFFVYLATYLPHDPHTVPDKKMVNKYKGSISDYVAYFFAGIDRIDQNIGKLRKVLEETGKAENTILIFMSDNGGTAGVKLYNAGMRGKKTQPYEGGHRVPFFIHWPDGNLKHGKDVTDITAHFDVLPTLIDHCGLSAPKKVEFDGRSFKKQLLKPELKLSDRVLFVENQRTFTSQQWHQTAGMMNNWRLVNNKELYDLSKDFGQKNNVISQYPEVAHKIRKAYKAYWKRVSPGDRDKPRFIVGQKEDPEIFLSPSDWYLPKVPWNHAQVAAGSPEVGAWDITVSENGLYRFEVRRWPRETNAPIQGVPTFIKKVDSWTIHGGVDKFIYGNETKILHIQTIKLEVGSHSETKKVNGNDKEIVFELNLQKGDTTVKGTMFNQEGELIAGTYYIYLAKVK